MSSAVFGFGYSPLTGQIMAWDGAKYEPTSVIKASLTFGASFTMGDGSNIALDTTTGTMIGTAAAQKLAFWGIAPVVQPSGALQAAPAGYVSGAFGLDSDANMHALYDLVVAIRTALVATGIIKGAA